MVARLLSCIRYGALDGNASVSASALQQIADNGAPVRAMRCPGARHDVRLYRALAVGDGGRAPVTELGPSRRGVRHLADRCGDLGGVFLGQVVAAVDHTHLQVVGVARGVGEAAR